MTIKDDFEQVRGQRLEIEKELEALEKRNRDGVLKIIEMQEGEIKENLERSQQLQRERESILKKERELGILFRLEGCKREKDELDKKIHGSTKEIDKLKGEIQDYLDRMTKGEALLTKKFGAYAHPLLIPKFNRINILQEQIKEDLQNIRSLDICINELNEDSR